jgi:uncharacterized protein involved in exopolysaccharide biosynthesis
MKRQEENPCSASPYADYRSLSEVLLASLMRCKGALGLGLVVGAVAGYLVLAYTPPTYKAIMTLTSAASGREGLSLDREAIDGQQTPSKESLHKLETLSKFAMGIELISSVRLARILEEKHQISRRLLSLRQNPTSGEWERPQGLLSRISPLPSPPIGPDLIAQQISQRVTVKMKTLGVYEVAFIDRDPAFAAEFLTALYQEVEALMVEDARAENRALVDHLSHAMAEASDDNNRQAIADLLRAAQRQQIALEAVKPYAWRRLDPPSTPTVRQFPTRSFGLAVMVAVAMTFWLLAELFICLKTRSRRRKNDAG